MCHTLPALLMGGTCPASEESRNLGCPCQREAFLFQEEDPEVTEQVDEGSGPRAWSLQ